jgi:hypothetical protein
MDPSGFYTGWSTAATTPTAVAMVSNSTNTAAAAMATSGRMWPMEAGARSNVINSVVGQMDAFPANSTVSGGGGGG